MRKIIDLIKRTVKPGKSRRNPLVRTGFRKLTGWQRSVAELQALFIIPQNSTPILTWRQSVAELQAVVYA